MSAKSGQSKSALPKGVVASSVTPFHADGTLNAAQVKPHIDWLIDEGVAGLSPLGSAGEFFAIEADDRKRVLEAAIKANDGRVPVMAGTHHYSTKITVELSKHAEKAGADSLLIVPPFYALPTIDGVLDHYRRVADAVSIPIVLYHNTPGTAVDLTTAHLQMLFNEKVIAGVKMSTLMPDKIVELLQVDGPRMTVYAGIDYVAFEGLCHGADGWISGIPSIVPSRARRLYETITVDGDLKSAREQWRKLAPLMRFLFGASHINRGGTAHWAGVMKAALGMIGPKVGDLRPSAALGDADLAILKGLLENLGYKTK